MLSIATTAYIFEQILMKQKSNNQALHLKFKLDDFVSRYFDCNVDTIVNEHCLSILRSHFCLRYNIRDFKDQHEHYIQCWGYDS